MPACIYMSSADILTPNPNPTPNMYAQVASDPQRVLEVPEKFAPFGSDELSTVTVTFAEKPQMTGALRACRRTDAQETTA